MEKLFPVRPGERRLTAVMFLHNLSAVGVFIAGRSVRDALFLAHSSFGSLAWMYIASAFTVALAGLVYAPLAARWRRDHVALVSSLLFAACFGLAFVLARRPASWFYAALYVYVEVMGALVLVQFWTLVNELFHAREARRLYGLIGAGGMVANVVVGLATRQLARREGADAVLLLCAGLALGCAGASFLAGRMGKERLFAKVVTGARRVPALGGAARVWGTPHLRAIAWMSAITFLVTTFVDFEFKVMAAHRLQQDQLAQFFGGFYALVGALALLLQLFGTSQLLNRVGVVAALAVLPISLATGNLALALWGTLWAAALAKGGDSLFRYTINDATTQLLYLPVAPNARATAKAFIDGVVKSGAIAVAGVVLMLYRRFFGASTSQLAWITCALCAVWGLSLLAIRSQYLRSLQENLRSRRLDRDGSPYPYPVPEGSANTMLHRALEGTDARELLSALELLPHLDDTQFDDRVERLLVHPVPAVRTAALRYFAQRQTHRHANAIFQIFEDPDPGVRAAAIETFCTLGRDKAIRSVKAFLTDPEPAVRSAAIVGMIRFGGLDGVLSAAEALKGLISHERTTMRVHAAKVLGSIGVKNFYQPVLELMSDPDPAVRRQAITAAGQLQSQEFVIPLIYRTHSAETGSEAIEALAKFGEGIAGTLAKVLANPLEDISIRRSVARVLGRLGTPEAVEILAPHLGEPDEELRVRLYRALARTARDRRLTPTARRHVDSALELELMRAYGALQAAETLMRMRSTAREKGLTAERGAAADLLELALAEKVAQVEERVFLLLAVLYPSVGMEHIHQGIRDATEKLAQQRRANAVELLDNLLERKLKRRLLPLVEDLPRQEKLAAVAPLLTLPNFSEDRAVGELCRDETPWVRACALHFAAAWDHPEAAQAVLAAVGDPDAIVRETALVAALRVRPGEASALAELRREDSSAVVRRQALSMLGAGLSVR